MGNRDMTYACWRYRPTGQIWVVALRDGKIVGAVGGFDPQDVWVLVKPLLRFDDLDVPWIETERCNFDSCTIDPPLCIHGCEALSGE